MIPEHVIVLALVLIAGWVLYRWGVVIFSVYAIAHFIAGQWFEAGLAFFLACCIGVVQSLAEWLLWNGHGRGAWLSERRFRRFTP